MLGRQILFMDAEPSPSGEGVCGPARRRMRGACPEIACLRQAAENCGGVKHPALIDDTVRCRAACPHAAAVIVFPFISALIPAPMNRRLMITYSHKIIRMTAVSEP